MYAMDPTLVIVSFLVLIAFAALLAVNRKQRRKVASLASARAFDGDDADSIAEERMNLRQRIGELEGRVIKMTVRLNDGALNDRALKAALAIDDLFARGAVSVTQRTAQVQIIVREAIRELAVGGSHEDWSVSRPDTFRPVR